MMSNDSKNSNGDNGTAYIYARVPPKLHARVKEVADERGVSITQYVNEVLEQSVSSVRIPLDAARLEDGREVYFITISPDKFL